MILARHELELLTGRKRASAQARVLAYLGIPFMRRPDGSVLVRRVDVEGDRMRVESEPRLRMEGVA